MEYYVDLSKIWNSNLVAQESYLVSEKDVFATYLLNLIPIVIIHTNVTLADITFNRYYFINKVWLLCV